jgi:hypothetical protein
MSLEPLLSIFLDKTRSLSWRIAWALVLCLVVFLADTYFQFSYNYKLNARLQQIEKIETILKTTQDPAVKNALKQTQYGLLYTTTLSDYLVSLLSNAPNESNSAVAQSADTKAPNTIKKSTPYAHRNTRENENRASILFLFFFANWLLVGFIVYLFVSASNAWVKGLVIILFGAAAVALFVFIVSGILAVVVNYNSHNLPFQIVSTVLLQPTALLLVFAVSWSMKKVKKYFNQKFTKTPNSKTL